MYSHYQRKYSYIFHRGTSLKFTQLQVKKECVTFNLEAYWAEEDSKPGRMRPLESCNPKPARSWR